MAEDKIETKNKKTTSLLQQKCSHLIETKNKKTTSLLQQKCSHFILGGVPSIFRICWHCLGRDLYRDWMKTFGSEFQEVVRVHQRLRTTLMQQLFLLTVFFSIPHQHTTHFGLDLDLGYVAARKKMWNFIHSLSVLVDL